MQGKKGGHLKGRPQFGVILVFFGRNSISWPNVDFCLNHVIKILKAFVVRIHLSYPHTAREGALGQI